MALKLRRGTEAERVTAFVDIGEIVYVTDTKKVFVGDGATTGGILVGPVDAALFDVLSDTTPQLGGNLDLNGRNITGTGNISITGSITATGTINLGDGTEDNINVGGLINSSLNPAIDDSYSLGTAAKQWASLWATQVNVDTTLAVGSQIIKLSSGAIDSNLVLWDAETDTISSRFVRSDLIGSVLSDDSSIAFVDADSFTISNGTLTLDSNIIKTDSDAIFLASADNPVIEVVANSSILSVRKIGIDDSINNMTISSVEGARLSGGNIANVQNGDYIGTFTVSGYQEGQYVPKVLLVGTVDAATVDNPLPGKILFGLHDAVGDFKAEVSINSRHHIAAPVMKFTPFVDATARDTALPTGVVEAGMVIYLQSTNKLQVNANGTTAGWVDLN
jgi:hypothetical protein